MARQRIETGAAQSAMTMARREMRRSCDKCCGFGCRWEAERSLIASRVYRSAPRKRDKSNERQVELRP
jgi:hypothetical protein